MSLVLHGLILGAWMVAERVLPARRQSLSQEETSQKPKYTFMELDRSTKHVVRTQTGQITEKAAPDAQLSEKTRTVDRQTVAKNYSDATGGAASQPAIPLKKLGLGLLKDVKQDKPSNAFASADQGNGTGRFGEYLKGYKEGDTTVLNTKEYVFYGYFQRIRGRLERAWAGTLRERVYKMFQRGRRLASDRDLTTRTLVTMNGRGEVVKVQMVEESGIWDLDDAAVMAFNRAGPFPNPPSGIMGDDGTFQVRWDFVLRN